jgi:hypothetical protein
MASLAIVPVFLPFLVTAILATEPMVTLGTELLERANGANIIGYSASGTGCKYQAFIVMKQTIQLICTS